MKTIFKYFVILLVLSALTVLIYKTIVKLNYKEAVKERITTLPGMRMLTADSISFSIANLVNDKYLVLVWYNTGCEHCQYEAQEFRKNPGSYGLTQILLVSGEPLSDIRKFGKAYGVDTLQYLKLMHCDFQAFFNTFGTTSVPSIFIYSPDGRLLKQYNGETKLEAITKYLK
jgi:thioredoxin-related protein